jgi:DNA-binding response OmpR family regulator
MRQGALLVLHDASYIMKKKILIVDDEVELVTMLTFRLEATGYEVLAAHDGEAGLAKARAEKPDLILLDVMLPRKDGYQVCRELKANGSAIANIPVLIVSAKTQDSDRAVGTAAGCDGYVIKPFDEVVLMKTIEQFVGSG